MERTVNNRFHDCPARMDDGRHFTDYRQACYVNNLLRMVNNTPDSFDYRMFLTRNAENLQNANRQYIEQKESCKCTMK